MKALYFCLILLFPFIVNAQSVTVDDSGSASDFVNLVLNNSCLQLTNSSKSSGQSVGYFNSNNSNFPLSEGVVIRNGNVNYLAGSYNNSNLSSSLNANTDPFLQNLSNQTSGQTTPIKDIAFLEFDFVPAFNSFSFDFVFASNEYGEYQCISNDVFAFVLTDLTDGTSTNLALIPGSSDPISVRSVRNAAFNGGCTSTNPGYFGVFCPISPSISAINMRGYTTVMTAASDVIPNRPYKIRIAIADYGDSDFDSAVFIGGGSFETTFDLGPDMEICDGDSYLVSSNLDSSYTHKWFLNDVEIPNANSSSYLVTTPGTYRLEIDKGSCHIEDTVVFSPLSVTTPKNLSVCGSGATSYVFDLSVNDIHYLSLDSSIFELFYYTSMDDVTNNIPISNDQLASFSSPGNQTIYIKIFNTITNNFCDALYSFTLSISGIQIQTTSNAAICRSQLNYNVSQFNNLFADGLPFGTTLSYFTSQANAISNSNPINAITASFPAVSTLWVRATLQSGTSSCFDVASFTVTINPNPQVDVLEDVIACSEYQLPAITHGTYYKLSGGPSVSGQVQLNAGQIITEEGTYYIFSGPNDAGCSAESDFNLLLIKDYKPTIDNCGSFVIPTPLYNIGNFYTALGGPNGGGELIPSGTVFENTTNQTITQNVYFYSDVEGEKCVDKLFEIYIHPLPEVSTLTNVVTCNSYTLQPLPLGNYFTGPNGSGIPLFAGNSVSASTRIYIFNENIHTNSDGTLGKCGKQTAFDIFIVPTALFVPKVACGEWSLPPVPFGGYFTQPNGQGVSIPANSKITTSQTVYYFANTTTFPNCTQNLSYQITINPRPPVDVLPNVVACGEYILPQLTHGKFYKLSGGPNVPGQLQYFPNQVIDLSGTSINPGIIYIYVPENEFGCTNESSFRVSINPLPPVDNVIDRIECNPYTIPTPLSGTVYTAPGGPYGTGSVVPNSEVFTQDKTFYIFKENPVTGCKSDVRFTVFYNGINLPSFVDENVCEYENYTLPLLLHTPVESYSSFYLGYFYEPGGVNPIPQNTVFNVPNTSTTVYVYAINEGRFGVTCIEEKSFEINVSKTPVLPSFAAINGNYCGTFNLPQLPVYDYAINYYSAPGGNPADLVTTNSFTVNPGEAPRTIDFWVFGHATNNRNCNDETHFQVTIYPLLTFEMKGGYICVDPISKETVTEFKIESGFDPNAFSVDWFLNDTYLGTGANFMASKVGIYTAVPTKLTPAIAPNCNYTPASVEIKASSSAIASAVVSAPFEDSSTISVVIDHGIGNYEYQLDEGIFQNSPEFTSVSSGVHTINVNDTLGYCGIFSFEVVVVKYPNFFTPNNDGFNDVWNIWDLKTTQPDAVISIYDRYGKFIKQLTPSSEGWDGTYNGNPLPSTDYWFTVAYEYAGVTKTFKSNFSLKK